MSVEGVCVGCQPFITSLMEVLERAHSNDSLMKEGAHFIMPVKCLGRSLMLQKSIVIIDILVVVLGDGLHHLG